MNERFGRNVREAVGIVSSLVHRRAGEGICEIVLAHLHAELCFRAHVVNRRDVLGEQAHRLRSDIARQAFADEKLFNMTRAFDFCRDRAEGNADLSHEVTLEIDGQR